MREAFHFQRFGIAPNAGGQRDQPLGWLDRVGIALNAFTAMKSYQSADSPERWAEANPETWEMAAEIRMLQRKRDKQNGN